MAFPKIVKMVEVSPRDGLQNEAALVPTSAKLEFINLLSETGLSVIETTSFVSPKWVPKLADHTEVFQGIRKKPNISYPVLVPNIRGLTHAIAAGVKEIAVFTTPSESFSQNNTNSSVEESMKEISAIVNLAGQHDIRVRAYLSCVLGCPYEGKIKPAAVVQLTEALVALGCYEVSLGDTIGAGTPLTVKKLLKKVIKKVPVEKIAVHFHDTHGLALTNIYVALELGIATIDSSVGGLGGCPYAKGASGNVASEKVLYMLNSMGIETRVDREKLLKAGEFIRKFLLSS